MSIPFRVIFLTSWMLLPANFTCLTEQSFAQVLLQESDLVYQGAFRLPQGDFGSPQWSGFNYGGTGLAYNPDRNSLYVVGHDWYQLTAEVSIPQQIINSADLNSLAVATVLQNFTDAFEGKIDSIGPGTHKVGGQLVDNNHLYLSAYIYYDAAGGATASHFVRPADLSTRGEVGGAFEVGTLNPGFVAGYMTKIPQEWQSVFGGTALTGNCCLSIISRTSLGPAAFSFNPADIGNKNPVSAIPLVYYPIDHPTLGTWGGNGSPNPIYNMGTTVNGIVFPKGSRSVLFLGSTGLGIPCYGEGTSNPNLDGKPVPGESGVIYCYDPNNGSKGCHAYPYAAYVWAYDAMDLAAVKNGQKNPWDIRPYATWPLNSIGSSVKGAAYDPATGRIYISVGFEDGTQPLMRIFNVNVAGGGDTTPPRAPERLRAK